MIRWFASHPSAANLLIVLIVAMPGIVLWLPGMAMP